MEVVQVKVGESSVELIEGDITELEVDAIVNAANTDLELGAGVAGAIAAKGGPVIQAECNKLAPIGLGQAAATSAGELRAKYVIHAAGMGPDRRTNKGVLQTVTRNTLLCAEDKKAKTVAFPAIGTGVGGMTLEDCAKIMLNVVLDYLQEGTSYLKKVMFALYGSRAFNVFKAELEKECEERGLRMGGG
ncbi:MAG: macro domain-containing protein [Candidatus Eiseniibacteriota bacterium]|nr:MAG: macro domain-containing protein [Candidatus Eisenbacteria bacterium]